MNNAGLLPRIHPSDATRIPADMGRATLQFDHRQPVHPQDQSWRTQKLLKPKSPRLFKTEGNLISSSEVAKLIGKSDDEVLQVCHHQPI